MSTTWGDLKQEFRDSFRDTSQNFIGDDELKRMCKRVLRLIDSQYTYGFQETSGTVPLTGATEYNLAAIFPDYKSLLTLTYAPQSSSLPFELEYSNPKDFAITRDSYAFTIQGSATLKLYGPTSPTTITGQLGLIYYSRYMVKVHGGSTLAEAPANDDDTFVIPERHLDVLTEGLSKFGFRKDRSHREDYTDATKEFDARLLQLQIEEPMRVKKPRRFVGGPF